MPITSLQDAQDASEAVFATDEWQWIHERLDQTCVDAVRVFEGHIPDRMLRALVSEIVEQGFERGEKQGGYYYHLYSESTEYKITVDWEKHGKDKITVRAEHCPSDL